MVKIYSIHGVFSHSVQKYILEDGSSSDYLRLATDLSSEHYSLSLCNFIEEWSNELSYKKLSLLLSQVVGNEVLSASGIGSYISSRAVCISKMWVAKSNKAVKEIAVKSDIDVMSSESKEIIVMMDDVGVKAQKPHKKVERIADDAKRLDTTVVLVQDDKGGYEYATSGIDRSGLTIYPIKQAIIDKVTNLHDTKEPLPIVAITDGARSIRNTLQAIFGFTVCIILDWYHLQLKVKNLMSMIAPNKELKELYINDLKCFLWNGEVAEALIYLDNMTRIKNDEKHQELRGYIEKHQAEIINYGLRQSMGKTIGSGRGEKANDLIVAHRQKKKGMAWSKKGSSSLAIVNTNRLNNRTVAA